MQILYGIFAGLIVAGLLLVLARARGLARVSTRPVISQWELMSRIQRLGVTNFYGSRSDYVTHRGAPRLTDYLSSADSSIKVAAYWMAHGNEAEAIAVPIAKLAEEKRALQIQIAVISPKSPVLSSLAEYLDVDLDDLRGRIRSSLRNLDRAREELSTHAKTRYSILVYDSLPIASVIMLDTDQPGGRIQIDIKPYRAPRDSSFGLELSGQGHPLYDVCLKAWTELMTSAVPFDRTQHLDS